MQIKGREAGLGEDEGLVLSRESGWRLGMVRDKAERQMDRGA